MALLDNLCTYFTLISCATQCTNALHLRCYHMRHQSIVSYSRLMQIQWGVRACDTTEGRTVMCCTNVNATKGAKAHRFVHGELPVNRSHKRHEGGKSLQDFCRGGAQWQTHASATRGGESSQDLCTWSCPVLN